MIEIKSRQLIDLIAQNLKYYEMYPPDTSSRRYMTITAYLKSFIAKSMEKKAYNCGWLKMVKKSGSKKMFQKSKSKQMVN